MILLFETARSFLWNVLFPKAYQYYIIRYESKCAKKHMKRILIILDKLCFKLAIKF